MVGYAAEASNDTGWQSASNGACVGMRGVCAGVCIEKLLRLATGGVDGSRSNF
jgi:hypothetical protein